MKTTVDIPELLYKKAKIRAVETGQTLKEVVLSGLQRELGEAPEPSASYWSNRELLPGFRDAQKAGAYRPKLSDRDITIGISEDRDAR